MMEQAERIAGWMLGLCGSIGTICASVYAWIQLQKRKEAEQKQADDNYFITQYKQLVGEIKGEFAKDGLRIQKVEAEFLKCREECARKDEEIKSLKEQLAEVRRRA
jgi:uncharacterized protein HemX